MEKHFNHFKQKQFSIFCLILNRFVLLMPIMTLTCLLLILSDSLYYGDLTLYKLWHLKMQYKDWKVGRKVKTELLN